MSPPYSLVHPLRWAGPVDARRPVPFPTLYWLNEGPRDRQVADLERRGFIKQLEARAQTDPAFAQALAHDHQRYAAARWALLDPDEQRIARDHGLTAALRDRGVAGTADFSKIKCLHAHVAHALHDQATSYANTNVVGQHVLDLLETQN